MSTEYTELLISKHLYIIAIGFSLEVIRFIEQSTTLANFFILTSANMTYGMPTKKSSFFFVNSSD